jgi:phenylacetate-CoA ligase
MRDLRTRELIALAKSASANHRLLRRTPFFSRDEMLAWQFTCIRVLITRAFERIPFYRSRYQRAGFQPGDLKSWDDFAKLPVVTRDDVVANYPHSILDQSVPTDQLLITHSSGSSGKVLYVAYDLRAYCLFAAAAGQLFSMAFNYLPWHRQLYIAAHQYPFQSFLGMYPMYFVRALAPIPQAIEALRRVKPHLLVCYPSVLRQVAQQMSDEEIAELPLKAISVNSEMSSQSERDEWQQRFTCPVLDDYASEELTRLAAQCIHRTYHLFEDINYIEILDDNDRPTAGAGTVTGTNLHNTAMPLIRYRQGDVATIQNGDCACGWRFRRLVDWQGRRNDSFVMPSGRVLSSGYLLAAVVECTRNGGLRAFSLTQENTSSICLKVVPSDSWTTENEGRIVAQFREFFGPQVGFRIEKVAECERTSAGKQNPIISRVSRQLQ